MADRAQPLAAAGRAGITAAAAVPALIVTTGAAVFITAGSGQGLSAADWAAIRFTLLQAVLSSLLSVLLAMPLARALSRRSFPGRRLVIALLGAPFLLPVIVAIFGLLAVFGRNGLVNTALEAVGLPGISVYGLHGVVLAHVFFNLPLASRLLLQGWLEIPAERFRLAASLGMSAAAVQRHLEVPMLMRAIPGALLLIFVICTTSFAVALILGGGPRATTVELAIYQALRFEFDLPRAAVMSAIQLVLTGLAAIAALRLVAAPRFGSGLDRVTLRRDADHPLLRATDMAVITLAAIFLLTPLFAVSAAGIPRLVSLPQPVLTAAFVSLFIALASALTVVSAGTLMSVAASRLGQRGWAIEGAGLFAIAASPLVIGTGLFLIINPWLDPSRLALPVTVLVNSMMTLPFALRILIPAVETIEAEYGRLADSLGITGLARFRLLLIPRLRRPLGFSAGIAAALSIGDLGVIALFADPETATLPLQIYRLMGAYRMDEAAGGASLLMLLGFSLFWIFDRGGRADAGA
ncbi:MAG: thiamine/thiamine pyrophosphate ABC transporter permease ThiP [Rhodobacteraceae bacterium]|nr:thiamine/thiamine pyrophosphate ABC transporter permease ThiP [Paracoccaceae bacterium]